MAVAAEHFWIMLVRHDVEEVLSDECELVSVWHECGDIMQHKVDATRREQRCVDMIAICPLQLHVVDRNDSWLS
jgi:hypothetical protein